MCTVIVFLLYCICCSIFFLETFWPIISQFSYAVLYTSQTCDFARHTHLTHSHSLIVNTCCYSYTVCTYVVCILQTVSCVLQLTVCVINVMILTCDYDDLCYRHWLYGELLSTENCADNGTVLVVVLVESQLIVHLTFSISPDSELTLAWL